MAACCGVADCRIVSVKEASVRKRDAGKNHCGATALMEVDRGDYRLAGLSYYVGEHGRGFSLTFG